MPRHGVVRQRLGHVGEDPAAQDLDERPQGQVGPLQRRRSARDRRVLPLAVETLHREVERRERHLQQIIDR